MQGFIIGIFLGAWLFAGMLIVFPSYHRKATTAIEACEATLPRDQHCTIIAIPVSKD